MGEIDRTEPPFADIGHFAHASRVVEVIVGAVAADQWEARTPCAEWNVIQVVEHLADVNLSFTAQLTATTSASSVATEPWGTAVERYRASTDELHQALSGAADHDGSLPTQIRGRLALRVADLLIHGWDIATATGQPLRLPEHLAEQALHFVQRRVSALRRSGQFAAPQPATADASAIDRLAALSGRVINDRAFWTPERHG